jgi:hypothetical protein
VADVDPVLGRGSSTLSRDTRQRHHRHQTDDLWRADEIMGWIALSVDAAICRHSALAEKKATRRPFFGRPRRFGNPSTWDFEDVGF